MDQEVSQAASATAPLQIERGFLLHILDTLSQSRNINEYLEHLVEHIKNYAQCGCVGIRLLDENGDIPYAAYSGFSRKFYESESPLSKKCDRCMCINVIEQNTDPKHSYYTNGGSFHSGGTTKLLATTPAEEKGATRNVCNAYGYETVVLVPMKHKNNVLGLIHLADKSESRIPKEKVYLLEEVAKYIGEALHTFIAERERERLLTQVGYGRRRVENLAGDLKKERDILGVIMENTKAHLAYLDADFNFIAVNSTYAEGSGHTISELIRKNHFDLFPDKKNQAIFEQVRDSGQPVEFRDKTFKFKDQPWRGVTYWDWTLSPVKDASGKVIGLVLSLVETTQRKKSEHDLGERFKEISCLYGVSQLVARSGISLDDVLQGTVDLIPPGWQYPEITCARINFNSREHKTGNFKATVWKQSSDIKVKGKKCGSLEVHYLEEKPEIDEGPFLKEERALIEGLTRTLSEMAERKQTEEELRRERDKAQQYLDVAGVMLMVIGTDQKVGLINKKGCQILGYKREEDVLGRNWFDNFLPKRVRRDVKDVFNKLVAGEVELVEHYENPVLARDGRERTIAWHNTVLRDKSGKITALLSSGEDITERKKLDQLKDELSGLVSHELRTPLTVIIGAVNTVLSEEDLLSTREKHQLLNDAAAEAESLSHLLGNLLELSRARAEQLILHAELVNTKVIVRNVIDKISKQTVPNRFSLDFPKGLPPAYADPLRLERILYNLLDNAIKYSPPESDIRISAKTKGRHLVIGVKDRGEGISAEDQSKLFAPFQRLENAGAKGIGLGLLVCRRLVEAHDGRIWVESRPGRGSTFLFTIPLKA